MAISINRLTNRIFVPKADLTLISGTLFSLDTDQFRLDLGSLAAAEEGIVFDDAHRHNTEETVAGITYARLIRIINNYQVEFEDGQYAVRLDGSNNDIFDEGIIFRNQVSIIPTNSAGLIRTDVAEKPTQSHVASAYDDIADVLEMTIWLERLGITVANPVSCSLDWFNPDGTLLFNVTDSSPDANGVFQITRASTTLVANTAYYAEVTVTDTSVPADPILTLRGVPTGP